MELVLATGRHDDRVAAIVDVVVQRDEVQELGLFLCEESDARQLLCKGSCGKQAEERRDLHGVVGDG